MILYTTTQLSFLRFHLSWPPPRRWRPLRPTAASLDELKGADRDFITPACPETRPFGLARSFKPPPSRRSTAHSATDDQDHKLRDRFASLSASSPARRALLEKSSLAAWRALNLDLALRRACSSGERRCKPWSRRPNLGVLHVVSVQVVSKWRGRTPQDTSLRSTLFACCCDVFECTAGRHGRDWWAP